MTSILNLFSNFDDLTKKKSVTDSATAYTKHKFNLNTPTPALSQGNKFKTYQKKIKKDLVKKAEILSGKEGFEGLNLKDMNLNANGLTIQSDNIINSNNYSSQQQNIDNLRKEYASTLNKYESLLANISGSSTDYINRVSANNPYLGKYVEISGKAIFYVTKQGVAKMIPNSTDTQDAWSMIAGQNGCPLQSSLVTINVPWNDAYMNAGATIPTTPPLITGSPMKPGQSCGNEGENIYVNQMISNPSSTYEGCYADNLTSPLMTFIGDRPPVNTNLVKNGNFDEHATLQYGSWGPFNDNSSVPGWDFNACIVNLGTSINGATFGANIGGWGEIGSAPGNMSISQTLSLGSGLYTLSFYALLASPSNGNTITPLNVYLNNSVIYSYTPVNDNWTNFKVNFNVPNGETLSSATLLFSGILNYYTYIANIQLTTGASASESNGSYSYEQCQQSAIDSGYQYFALQDVNPSTNRGYCAVSNNEISAKTMGTSYVESGMSPVWATNKNGAIASLTVTGALTVSNSSGQVIYSTPQPESAAPANYLGCYADNPNRAMDFYNGGSQQYNNEQCQQFASQQGYAYYGLQNSTSGTTAQCALSNDLNQATQYGLATNCTQISDGSWSGGGWSNAIYNTKLPQSSYYLILEDDANLSIYKGKSPDDNQGLIWTTGTSGKQNQPNPDYSAENSKYGQNWMPSGSSLAGGEFIGSPNGYAVLIMQTDGNLVLYNFSMAVNCNKMSDGKMGGGVGANALYNIGKVGNKANISQLAYIDQNAELHSYPTTNVQYMNSYTEFSGNSPFSDIPGAAYGNATIEQCESSCNGNKDCAGFVFDNANKVCWPKNTGMYPNSNLVMDKTASTYVRNKMPRTTPIGVTSNTNNTDSITYGNYVDGGPLGDKYGISNATAAQQQELAQLQSQMNLLSSQINNLTNNFQTGSSEAENQVQTNVKGIGNYLTDLKKTNKKIKNFSTNMDNILKDSDIVVLQKNYDYLFWTILAVGSVLISINLVKK